MASSAVREIPPPERGGQRHRPTGRALAVAIEEHAEHVDPGMLAQAVSPPRPANKKQLLPGIAAFLKASNIYEMPLRWVI